jgi:hypothetical protein
VLCAGGPTRGAVGWALDLWAPPFASRQKVEKIEKEGTLTTKTSYPANQKINHNNPRSSKTKSGKTKASRAPYLKSFFF